MQSLNGVPLLTKAGHPKSRFTKSEKLQICGATTQDLDDFLNLFAPRRPLYAVTRNRSDNPRDWTTPRGRLDERIVLEHLLAGSVPGRCPRWVAPRCWETTSWIGLDVDFRSDREDFRQRCREVQTALKILGIPRKGTLVSSTPSGGRHYRFFLRRDIRVNDIRMLFSLVGIQHKPGSIELFPSSTQGMRLPFGFLPGRKRSPHRWGRFIRAFQAGEIPRMSWLRIIKRAERYAQTQFDSMVCPASSERSSPTSCPILPRLQSPAKPARVRKVCALGVPKSFREDESEYSRLMAVQWASPGDASTLWNLGIQKTGSRIQATKKLAWHLIRVRREPVEQVKSRLVDWVYQGGARSSKDVQNDLRQGTRLVQKQTELIVEWCAKLPCHTSSDAKVHRCFTEQELRVIHEKLNELPPEIRKDRFEFALRILNFSKTQGQTSPEGWECPIAARGIFRKWPGCSGMRYKKKRDDLERIGLIEMIREKRQRSDQYGRPRTYRIAVLHANERPAFSFHEALEWFDRRCGETESLKEQELCLSKASDTYGTFVLPIPENGSSPKDGAATLTIQTSNQIESLITTLLTIKGQRRSSHLIRNSPNKSQARTERNLLQTRADFFSRESSRFLSPVPGRACHNGGKIETNTIRNPLSNHAASTPHQVVHTDDTVTFRFPSGRIQPTGFGIPRRFVGPVQTSGTSDSSHPEENQHPRPDTTTSNLPSDVSIPSEVTYAISPHSQLNSHPCSPRLRHACERRPSHKMPHEGSQLAIENFRRTFRSPPRYGEPVSDEISTLPETVSGRGPPISSRGERFPGVLDPS